MNPDQKRQMRSAARLYAVQALFQMEAAGSTVDRVTREFETHRFGEVQDDGVEMDPQGYVQLGHSEVPDPQKLRDNTYLLF